MTNVSGERMTESMEDHGWYARYRLAVEAPARSRDMWAKFLESPRVRATLMGINMGLRGSLGAALSGDSSKEG